eukprot:882997_1
MSAVAALCYHVEKQSFLFVKQFRAPVYYNRMKTNTLKDAKSSIDNDNDIGHQIGCTIECIAGLLDKKELTPLETIHEELKEEVGYKVPLDNIKLITNYRSAVGIIGTQTKIYFAKIDDNMKIGDGG